MTTISGAGAAEPVLADAAVSFDVPSGDMPDSEVEQLDRGVFGGEVARILDDPPELEVRRLDHVCCVDHPPAYQDVAPAGMPHASMNARITQRVGVSFGTAIVAVVLQSLLAHGAASASQSAFWWAVSVTIAAVISAYALPANKDGVLA